MAAALRSLDFMDLGYPVATGFHHGDWMDAADIYRGWAAGARVPFLAQGPVTGRRDVGVSVRDSAFLVRYSFGFYDTTPVAGDEDEERLGAVIGFFRENEPDLGGAVSFVGVIGGREDADIPRESWYGSRGRPELDGELKSGVSEIIDWLMKEYGIPSGHNRDTGNWRLEKGSTEDEIFEKEDVLHRAIVRRWDGTPHRKPWSEIHRSICSGSQWQMARRLAIRTATVEDSRGEDGGGPGFQFLIASGQGTVPKLCYAPLLGDNPVEDHRHPVGGGSWWNERFSVHIGGLRAERAVQRSHRWVACTLRRRARVMLAPGTARSGRRRHVGGSGLRGHGLHIARHVHGSTLGSGALTQADGSRTAPSRRAGAPLR